MKCKECPSRECKHKNLKYCECCNSVVCVDCDEKWEKPFELLNQWPDSYGITYKITEDGGTTCGCTA